MAFEPVQLQPLERGYLRVLRIRSAIGWTIVSAIAAAAGVVLHWRTGVSPGVVAAPVILLGLISTIFLVPRRWRRWGYAFTDSELHLQSQYFDFFYLFLHELGNKEFIYYIAQS